MRKADRGDLGELCAMWLALSEHHAAFDPHFALRPEAEAEVRRLLRAQLSDPECAIFLAEGADGAEGFAIVRVASAPPIHPETRRAEISDLFVAAGRRRLGLGRALLDAASSWASARGAERIEVRVAPDNSEGQAFWRGAGYGAHMDVLHRRL